MTFPLSLKKIIEKLKKAIKNILELIQFYQQTPYCIEKIDTKEQTVVIRCRGKHSIIKNTFGAMISDEKIIDGLSPAQACMLGGYYGRAMRSAMQDGPDLKETGNTSFLLKDTTSRYKILYQNHSDEHVGYFDMKKMCEFLEHPLIIVNSQDIVAEFSSSHACYLGFLAGISMEKAIFRDKKTGRRTLHRLLNKPLVLTVVQ